MKKGLLVVDGRSIPLQLVRPAGRTEVYPKKGRLLAVGDIHGHLQPLKRLLQQVKPTREDRIVFLGDYIDRGPESCGVVDFLVKFRRRFPRTVCLRGNHDQMLCDAIFYDRIRGSRPLSPEEKKEEGRLLDRLWYFCLSDTWEAERMFYHNSGASTLKSYGRDLGDVLPAHVDFLSSLPFAHMEDPIHWNSSGRPLLFLHGGLKPGDQPKRQREMDLLWHRHDMFDDQDHFPYLRIVHGHTVWEEPEILPHRIGLDTGAGYGKILTCCEVLTGRVWQECTA